MYIVEKQATGASVSSHYLAIRDTRTRIKGCPGDMGFSSQICCVRDSQASELQLRESVTG